MKYLLIIIVALVLATGQAFAFTWEGELDPNDFNDWEVISVQPTPQGPLWMFLKNPDETSPIDIVAIAVDRYAELLMYRYFKYGIPHVFIFDSAQEKYVEKPLTEKDKGGCMKCHESDKLLYRQAT